MVNGTNCEEGYQGNKRYYKKLKGWGKYFR